MLRECIVLDDDKFKAASDIYKEMDLTDQNIVDTFLAAWGVKLYWSEMWGRYQLHDIDYDPDFF